MLEAVERDLADLEVEYASQRTEGAVVCPGGDGNGEETLVGGVRADRLSGHFSFIASHVYLNAG